MLRSNKSSLRFPINLTAEESHLIHVAATLKGMPKYQFIVETVLAEAEKVIKNFKKEGIK